MTLPSRSRSGFQKRGFLGDLEAALNVNGNQRIAQLQCSIFDAEAESALTVSTHGSNDDRAPSNLKFRTVEDDGPELANTRLDINFACNEAQSSSSNVTQHNARYHVFGAVENTRAKVETAREEGRDQVDITYARKRSRFAGVPVVERLVKLRHCHVGADFLLHSNPMQVPFLA